MNAKKITKLVSIETIDMCGYHAGKSIKGKGLEVFQKGTNWLGSWSYSVETGAFATKAKEKIEEAINGTSLEEAIAGLEVNRMFIKDNSEGKYPKTGYLEKEDMPSVFDVIYGDALKGCSEIYIHQKGKHLGHIALSKYDHSLDSQRDLAKAIIAMDGKKIYGDLDDYADAENFHKIKNSKSLVTYHTDLEQIHGESYFTFDKGSCKYFDGRMSNNNNYVMSDFWQQEQFDEGGFLEETDNNSEYVVFHRKGKDFYISPVLNEEDLECAYFEGDLGDYDGFETESFQVLTYKENEELEIKILQYLKDRKSSLEDDCYLYNELGIYNEDMSYCDNVFDVPLLKAIFEDIYEARNKIQEILDYTLPIKEACIKANNEIISRNVTFLVDGTIIVKTVPGSNSQNQESKELRFNQLKVIKRLQNKLGYELVWSKINKNQRGSDESLAIKAFNEEYHFGLDEIINNDEVFNTIDFIRDCLAALNRRANTAKAKELLKTKADYVFVGLEDSYASGNCQIGTLDFVKRFNIDTNKIGGIRGDELLKMENSDFTRRAVLQAILSHGMKARVA